MPKSKDVHSPPLDPQTIFRQAVNFEHSANILSHCTRSYLVSLARSGGMTLTAPVTEGETITPGGVILPAAETFPAVGGTLTREMLFRIPTMIPQIVTHSFATELYLKCILVLDGVKPWGHKLAELFGELRAERKARLESLFDEINQSDPAFLEHERDRGEKVSLEFALRDMNIAYDSWRYAYEDGPRTGCLGRPWVAARALVLELKPEWKETLRNGHPREN